MPSITPPHLPRRLGTRLRVVSLLLLAPLVAVAGVSVLALLVSRSSSRSVDTRCRRTARSPWCAPTSSK